MNLQQFAWLDWTVVGGYDHWIVQRIGGDAFMGFADVIDVEKESRRGLKAEPWDTTADIAYIEIVV